MQAPSSGQILGHYRLVEQIGAGGMGVVFRAHDEQLQRDVAVKILPTGLFADDASRKQFRKEALAVGKLNHPNIAMAFDFGEEGGIDYLVTEYIPGVNLDEMLGQQPLPQKTVLEFGIQLARGLEAAHRENVIHRDLKPGNLRVNPDGQLKILDFGLAKLVEPDENWRRRPTSTPVSPLPERCLTWRPSCCGPNLPMPAPTFGRPARCCTKWRRASARFRTVSRRC